MKVHLFSLRLSYSGKAVHRVFASQSQQAFMEGHVEEFRVLGGVPTRHIRYDNLKPAVHRICFGRTRIESQSWVAFRSFYHSVPAMFISRKMRLLLRANEVLVFDGRQLVARHPRINRKFDYGDELDHFLEIMLGKPGALAGSTALAQARADGSFMATHEQFWEAARTAHGGARGTRVLIEVLLLHRHRPADAVITGMQVVLEVGSTTPEFVAI